MIYRTVAFKVIVLVCKSGDICSIDVETLENHIHISDSKHILQMFYFYCKGEMII